MVKVERYKCNPILRPNREHPWEALAAFNGCVVRENEKSKKYHMVYRAISYKQIYRDHYLNISSVGYAESDDGINFKGQRLFISPEFNWEIFGCEDPRITKIDDKYFIFYTGLSNFPPNAIGIKVGVAVTKDFVNVEKHPVTPFNAKAMALFPKRINGKLAALLTINTDLPPAKICIAYFDEESQIWSYKYWTEWFSSADEHVVLPPDNKNDQIELGSPPIETKYGWLVIYAYIKNYLSPPKKPGIETIHLPKKFGIEAILFDLKDPSKIIGRTRNSLLVPELEYELYGFVPNVIFPSGALVQNGKLYIYYGSADTTCCLATCNLDELIKEMTSQ